MNISYDLASVTRLLFLAGVVRLFVGDLIAYLNKQQFAEKITSFLKLVITSILVSVTLLANFLDHSIDKKTFLYALVALVATSVIMAFVWYRSRLHDLEIEMLDRQQRIRDVLRLEQKIDHVEKLITEALLRK